MITVVRVESTNNIVQNGASPTTVDAVTFNNAMVMSAHNSALTPEVIENTVETTAFRVLLDPVEVEAGTTSGYFPTGWN